MQFKVESLKSKVRRRIFGKAKNFFLRSTFYKLRSKQGFTLIEVLMVIVVSVIIAVIVFGAFSRYRRNQAVDTSARIVLSALQEARQDTLDSLDASQYGVNFSSSTLSIFKGASLSGGILVDEFQISRPVEIDEISISGGNEVLFERLTGATDNTGYVIVREPGTPQPSKKIVIEKTGIAYVE